MSKKKKKAMHAHAYTHNVFFLCNEILSAQLIPREIKSISSRTATSAWSKPCNQDEGLFILRLHTPLPPITTKDDRNTNLESSYFSRTDNVGLTTQQKS